MKNTGAPKFVTGLGFVMMFVIMCLGGGLVYVGFQEFWDAREFPKPETISYADLVRRRPSHGWFEVTGGSLMVGEAAWEQQAGSAVIKRAFVPLYGGSLVNTGGKAAVLVETKDPEILEQIPLMIMAGSQNTAVPGMPNITRSPQRETVTRTVLGRIPRFGRSSVISGRMSSQHVDMQSRLASGYVYLAEGEAPSSGAAWGFIGLGATIIAGVGGVIVKIIQEQSGRRA